MAIIGPFFLTYSPGFPGPTFPLQCPRLRECYGCHHHSGQPLHGASSCQQSCGCNDVRGWKVTQPACRGAVAWESLGAGDPNSSRSSEASQASFGDQSSDRALWLGSVRPLPLRYLLSHVQLVPRRRRMGKRESQTVLNCREGKHICLSWSFHKGIKAGNRRSDANEHSLAGEGTGEKRQRICFLTRGHDLNNSCHQGLLTDVQPK